MIKFNSYKELITSAGIDYEFYKVYLENELSSFLECIGGDIVENNNIEPSCTFKFELEGKNLEIGVTSIIKYDEELEVENAINYYWLMD